MNFNQVVETVGKSVDGAGVAVTVLGIVAATGLLVGNVRRAGHGVDLYSRYRQGIGRAILLGLEFLVAADIIRTVAVTPTFRSAGVLAIIVVIRTFLSMALEHELKVTGPAKPTPVPPNPGGT